MKHVSRYRDQLRGVSIEVVGRNDRDKRTPGVYITCLRNEHLSIIHMLLNLILGLNLIDGFEPDLVMGQTYMDSIASDATSGRTSTSSRRTGRREPRPRGRKGRTSTLRLA
ncbi:MAG TPA: hypothetical protein VI322_02170 [Candidatus Saccharimonadia bacterium]